MNYLYILWINNDILLDWFKINIVYCKIYLYFFCVYVKVYGVLVEMIRC